MALNVEISYMDINAQEDFKEFYEKIMMYLHETDRSPDFNKNYYKRAADIGKMFFEQLNFLINNNILRIDIIDTEGEVVAEPLTPEEIAFIVNETKKQCSERDSSVTVVSKENPNFGSALSNDDGEKILS